MIINIPLSKAYELLEKASAIIVSSEPGRPLSYHVLDTEEDAELPEIDWFLLINWVDDDGLEYSLKCNKENNLNPQIDTLTNELILTDDTGEKVNLTLLTTMKL